MFSISFPRSGLSTKLVSQEYSRMQFLQGSKSELVSTSRSIHREQSSLFVRVVFKTFITFLLNIFPNSLREIHSHLQCQKFPFALLAAMGPEYPFWDLEQWASASDTGKQRIMQNGSKSSTSIGAGLNIPGHFRCM